MKALTFHGIEKINYETVANPKLVEPTDVIVKVELSAICGSDLHIYHGRETGIDHGTIMGHEFTGEIIEKGLEVCQFKTGTKVISPFSVNCGKCFYCQQGLTSRCIKSQPYGWVQDGKGLQGVQTEYVRVPMADSTLLAIPESILPEEAILLGDVFSTGYFCADMAQVTEKGVYAVIGCGPVGLMAIIAAREMGAKTIYAIDAVPSRLLQAQTFGANALNYQTEDVLSVIKEKTDGRGADAVLEVVGNFSAAKLAMDLLRPGGIIAVAGVHTENHFAFSPAKAYDKNLTYKTGRCSARFYAEKLIPIVQQKKYDLSSIISHKMPLSEGARAYEIFDKKLENCTKVILIS